MVRERAHYLKDGIGIFDLEKRMDKTSLSSPFLIHSISSLEKQKRQYTLSYMCQYLSTEHDWCLTLFQLFRLKWCLASVRTGYPPLLRASLLSSVVPSFKILGLNPLLNENPPYPPLFKLKITGNSGPLVMFTLFTDRLILTLADPLALNLSELPDDWWPQDDL